jgi:hypothetical protein
MKTKRNLKGEEIFYMGCWWTVTVESYPGYWLATHDGRFVCFKTAEAIDLLEKSHPTMGGDSAMALALGLVSEETARAMLPGYEPLKPED